MILESIREINTLILRDTLDQQNSPCIEWVCWRCGGFGEVSSYEEGERRKGVWELLKAHIHSDDYDRIY